MRRGWLALLLLAGAVGCASMQKDQTVCPEYRNLRCGTDTECTMDKARGCRVCRCAPASDLQVPPPEDTRPPE